MSSFFQKTCKILGILTIRTSTYHPESNGTIELWHHSLHAGLSHYVNAFNSKRNTLVPLFLMAYHATANTVTGYSRYYFLHGREMTLRNSDNLKARVAKENPKQVAD